MVTEFRKCERDALHFLHYVRTLDPNEADPALRIKPFPVDFRYLVPIIDGFMAGDNMHVLKTRRMMVTNTLCALFLWALMFNDGWSGFVTSRKQELVDDGGSRSTWNSLMGKVRFMYEQLPPWLKLDVAFAYMRITCESRNTLMVGESGNVPDAGRGGGFTHGFMDEAAKIANSETLYSAMKLACNSVVMNSTPFGKRGVFYRIHKAASTSFTRIRCGWRDHPERDDAWYERECQDLTPEQIAEELDMSFDKSVKGRCFPEFDYDKHVTALVQYKPDKRLMSGWDFGFADHNAVVFMQQERDEFLIPTSLQKKEMINTEFGPLAVAVARRLGYSGPIEAVYSVGDADGSKRSRQSGISDIQDFARHGGWRIYPWRSPERDRNRIWRRLFKSMRVKIHPCNVELIDCLEQLHYPLDAQGEVTSTQESAPEAHKWSDLPAAGGYLLTRLEPVGKPAKPQLIAGI